MQSDGDGHFNFAARDTLTLEVPILSAKHNQNGGQRKTIASSNICSIGNLKWYIK
jgi:hypothetical protein